MAGFKKKKLLNTKCLFLSETFIVARSEGYMINNVYWSVFKVHVILV